MNKGIHLIPDNRIYESHRTQEFGDSWDERASTACNVMQKFEVSFPFHAKWDNK